MEAVPFRLSRHPAARRTLLLRYLVILLTGVGLTACGTTRQSQRAAFSRKMDSLRGEAVLGRIPRARVLAVLELSEPPTERIFSGARGGYTREIETWRLPWGDDITCVSHHPLSRKDAEFTRESIDALIAGPSSPEWRRAMKRPVEASRRPKTPPWHDTLIWRDRRNRTIRTVECDYRRHWPPYRG